MLGRTRTRARSEQRALNSICTEQHALNSICTEQHALNSMRGTACTDQHAWDSAQEKHAAAALAAAPVLKCCASSAALMDVRLSTAALRALSCVPSSAAWLLLTLAGAARALTPARGAGQGGWRQQEEHCRDVAMDVWSPHASACTHTHACMHACTHSHKHTHACTLRPTQLMQCDQGILGLGSHLHASPLQAAPRAAGEHALLPHHQHSWLLPHPTSSLHPSLLPPLDMLRKHGLDHWMVFNQSRPRRDTRPPESITAYTSALACRQRLHQRAALLQACHPLLQHLAHVHVRPRPCLLHKAPGSRCRAVPRTPPAGAGSLCRKLLAQLEPAQHARRQAVAFATAQHQGARAYFPCHSDGAERKGCGLSMQCGGLWRAAE